MEPNVINLMEVNCLILKTKQKNTKLPLGDAAQEEMKFHYVAQCDLNQFCLEKIIVSTVVNAKPVFLMQKKSTQKTIKFIELHWLCK